MKTLTRTEVGKASKDYREMLKKEKHHKHEIIEDEHGTYRWKANPTVRDLIGGKLNLNDIWILFNAMGYTKNSEVMRQMYRDMGYSLSGYWEIFYWEMNNENADEYVPNPSALGRQI